MQRSYRFVKRTTIHGVADVYTSFKIKNWYQTIFWSIILTASLAAVAYEIFRVIQRYLDSPLITTIKIVSVVDLPFPSLVLCPSYYTNASKMAQFGIHPRIIRSKQLGMAGIDSILMKNLFPADTNPFTDDFFANSVLSSKTKAEAIDKIKGVAKFGGVQDLPDAVAEQIYISNSTKLQTEYEQFLKSINSTHPTMFNGSKYMDMDVESILELVGFDKNQVSCTFFGDEIDCGALARPVYDIQKGFCYHLNLNRSQTVAGVGFNMVVDLNREASVAQLPAMYDGVILAISHQYETIDKHLKIPTGTSTTVGLRAHKLSLQNAQYADNCIDHLETTYSTYPYSNTACRIECYFKISMELCGCSLHLPKEFRKIANAPPVCKDPFSLNCTMDFASRPTTYTQGLECATVCKPRCTKWDYYAVTSYSKFPSSSLLEFQIANGNTDISRWEHNMLYLNIAFESMEYTSIEQDVSATIDQLGAEVGGWLGLLLGASVMSIIQAMTIFCCCSCSKNVKQDNEVTRHGQTVQRQKYLDPSGGDRKQSIYYGRNNLVGVQ